MKKKIILFSCILLSFLGCKKIDKLTQFHMSYDQGIVIPASSAVNIPFSIVTPTQSTNSASTFDGYNTRKDLIQKIELTTLQLTITSPSDGTFRFLKSATLFISADGLPEIEIASKDNVPDNVGNTLSLDVTGADIKDYIKQDSFSLRLKAETDEAISEDQHINIHSVFFVDAKILGI